MPSVVFLMVGMLLTVVTGFFSTVGCVRPDAGAPLVETDARVLAEQTTAGGGGRRTARDEKWQVATIGHGQSAQKGLPEVDLTFRNPDGSSAVFRAEVASTDVQRATGLMFRKSLAPERAMLFVFGDETVRSFYMKNTFIALDMVFVSADGVVAGVVENARPLTLDSRGVDEPARFVVEINAWEASRRGIRAGSVMTASPASVLSF